MRKMVLGHPGAGETKLLRVLNLLGQFLDDPALSGIVSPREMGVPGEFHRVAPRRIVSDSRAHASFQARETAQSYRIGRDPLNAICSARVVIPIFSEDVVF